MILMLRFCAYFYPRSPCGERREPTALRTPHQRFLSTLSLRRATFCVGFSSGAKAISIHALLAESDPVLDALSKEASTFLSTLSLRRATVQRGPWPHQRRHFYPRSPCGERPLRHQKQYGVFGISIHALLAESDYDGLIASANFCKFLSTLSLRRATISCQYLSSDFRNFYPRSPCGERRLLMYF